MLALGLVCYPFSRVLRYKLFIQDLSYFFIQVCTTITFPLSTALAASYKFDICVFIFIHLKVCSSFPCDILLTHWLFKTLNSTYLHLFQISLVLLISNLIPFYAENILCIIVILFNL